MKLRKMVFSTIMVFCCLFLLGLTQTMAEVNARFDASKMGDMSDFDPNNPVIPTGDTIKIAIVASFSGPAAVVGQMGDALRTLVEIHADPDQPPSPRVSAARCIIDAGPRLRIVSLSAVIGVCQHHEAGKVRSLLFRSGPGSRLSLCRLPSRHEV